MEKIEVFLYLLARDHLTMGQIETLLSESMDPHNCYNGELKDYAKRTAKRLGCAEKKKNPSFMD